MTVWAYNIYAQTGSQRYLELADSADNYIKRERWGDAERILLTALRLEPGNFHNSLLLSNLGVVRTNLGRYEQALEDFGLGLSIAPKSTVLRNNRSRTLLYAGRYDEALADLDSTLELDSVQEWPLQMRGMLRLTKGDTEGAKHDFTLLAAKFHKNSAAMAGLGHVAEAEGRDGDAIRYYDEAIAMNPDPETWFARIMLKIKMDKYSDAAEDIRGALDKYPELPDFYVARGYLHRLNFRNREAMTDKKIALDKGAEPQFVELYLPDTR